MQSKDRADAFWIKRINLEFKRKIYCIYQWRGADPNIILNICGYYDIQKFILSTNYRCAGEIVNRASVGIKNNVKRIVLKLGDDAF